MSDSDGLHGELQELVRATRAWVSWVQDSGVVELPGDWVAAEAAARQATAAGPAGTAHETAAVSHAQTEHGPPDGDTPGVASPAGTSTGPVEPEPSPEARLDRLRVLQSEVASCTQCRLHEERTQTVFSRGDPSSDLVFVGEGPGFHEDQQGLPFVGPAGELLDKMIGAMGYERDEVYICNVVKCRPPKNRKPDPDEMDACSGYLRTQLDAVRPQVIVALGATAVQGLIGTSAGITRLRGQWKLYRGRVPIMPTFHPAYLLRSPSKKRDVWNDLKAVLHKLGRTPPTPGKKSRG